MLFFNNQSLYYFSTYLVKELFANVKLSYFIQILYEIIQKIKNIIEISFL